MTSLLPLSALASGQTAQSTEDLIRSLDDEGPAAGTCGSRGHEYFREQDVAARLVALGSAATLHVEAAMQQSIEAHKIWPETWWLLHVYAKLKGPEAYPVFSRMIHDPKLKELRGSLDDAMALALGLTSYVDSTVKPAIGICDRFERRDGLNIMIFAWETGNLDTLRRHLGPHAATALDSLLAKRSWQDLRRDLSAPYSAKGLFVGYRFDVPPPWAEPYEPLESKVERLVRAMAMPLDDDAAVGAAFADHSGDVCGRRAISFALISRVSARPRDGRFRVEVVQNDPEIGFEPEPKYLVDNADLADLLHLISACAAR